MTNKDFNACVDNELFRCKQILQHKQDEYSDEYDRLDHFKRAAGLLGKDAKNALCGMMSKHTVSIYEMCQSSQEFSIEKWEEKITDHINYLLLLYALICEEEEN